MALLECNVQTNPQGREMHEHGSADFPVACYHDDLMKDGVPWHWHDELEAGAVTEGEVVIATDAARFTVRAGEGFFINSGVLHSCLATESASGRIHSLVFHPRLIGGDEGSVFFSHYLTPLLADPAQKGVLLTTASEWNWEAICAIEDAWQCLVKETAGYEFRVREALSHLTFLLTRHRSEALARPTVKAQRDGARIKTMLQYVQAHFAENLHVGKIASSALIGEGECLRCFRTTIGTTPMQYVKRFRIQKAAELLEYTDGRVSEIAAQCGFWEMSYFSKTFRESYGCTPSEYRKRQRSGVSE